MFKPIFETQRSLLVGGYSALLILCISLTPLVSLDWFHVALIAAFFANGPHFAVSYLIFYRRYTEASALPVKRFFVGFVLPFGLISICGLSVVTQSTMPLMILFYTMTILVGLHYVKQGFGVFIYENARKKLYLTALERRLLLGAMYLLWVGSLIISWSAANRLLQYYQVEFITLSISPDFIAIGYSLLVMSLITCVYALYRFCKSKGGLVVSGAVGVLIQFIWVAPLGFVPEVLYIIPFFHSLQYLLISNEAINRIDPKRTLNPKRHFIQWWGLSFILGYLGFEYLPKFLDSSGIVDLNATYFLVSFILVINIHHYLIDGVIWTKKSRMVQ